MDAKTEDVNAANTRLRALGVARELFAENGYAGTSIADIADRLGVSKAAVYYHFHAKGDLLQELIAPIFEQLRSVCAAPPDPRTLVERIVDVLAAHRSTIGFVAGDPSVAQQLKARTPREHFSVLIDALAGPRASRTRQLRARCAIGAIHAAVVGPLLEQQACADVSEAAVPAPMTRRDRRVVVDAALAALGD